MIAPRLALAGDLAGLFADPLGFVRYAYEWGKGELEGVDGPDRWQSEQLEAIGWAVRRGDPVREAVAAGHGVGKGAEASFITHWAMSTRPNLAGVVTANTRAQLLGKTWRELQVWHNRLIPPLRAWFTWAATRYSCNFAPRTWGVDAIPWSIHRPEAFAGLHAPDVLVIFDEASAIPDSIWDVAEGAMTTKGAMWFVMGNPTRNTGRFHACFHRFRHRWTRRQIDSRTARFTDKGQLDRWVEDYGEDSDFVRIRVRGVFPRSSSAQLISTDLFQAARRRPVADDPGAALLMGLDVARFGDDQSVESWRCGRDGRSVPWRYWRQLDTMDLAELVAGDLERMKPDAAFGDGGGVGGPVIDRIRKLGFPIFEVQFGGKARDQRKYANKRTEIWCESRDWLETGCVPDSDDLEADATGPEYSFDANGRMILEPKDVMKRRGLASPDGWDSFVTTFAKPIARRDLPRGRRHRAADVEVGFN